MNGQPAAGDTAETTGGPRVLYIVGSRRSGSTLLDLVLGEIPGFVAVGELNNVWKKGVIQNRPCGCGELFLDCPFWRDVGEEAFGGWDSIDVEAVLSLQQRVEQWRSLPLLVTRQLWPSYRARLDEYSRILLRLYEAIHKVSGRRVVVDSSKDLGQALLLRASPEVGETFLHLVRDSRGVAFSRQKRRPRPEIDRLAHNPARTESPSKDPLRTSAAWLAKNSLCHLLIHRDHNAMLVRYESFVADPQTECARVLELVGGKPDDGTLGFIRDGDVEVGVAHTVAGNRMRFGSGPLRLRLDEEWRRALPPRQRRLVSAVTWPLLALYGYRGAARERP